MTLTMGRRGDSFSFWEKVRVRALTSQNRVSEFHFYLLQPLGSSSAYAAANFFTSPALTIHSPIVRQPLAQSAKDVAHQRIVVFCPPIIRPFPVTTRFHQASALEMRKVARHFRLH